MDEKECVRRIVVSANMICKANESRINYSPEERLRFFQAAEIVLETVPMDMRKDHQKSFEKFKKYITEGNTSE